MLTIRQRELNLKHNGYYYTGAIDDAEGPLLRAAYGAFQEDHDLETDKVYGPKTDAVCIASAKLLQTKLNEHGANLKVDGEIGPLTIAAIEEFQKMHGLYVDGIAGVKTWEILNKPGIYTWDNVEYFTRKEFECDCGGRYCNGFPYEMDMKLIKILDELRAYYGEPITITSGVRCAQRNAEVGGISSSQHLYGKAADFYIPGACDSATGRDKVVKKCYELGAQYSYANTPGMGNAVHINI